MTKWHIELILCNNHNNWKRFLVSSRLRMSVTNPYIHYDCNSYFNCTQQYLQKWFYIHRIFHMLCWNINIYNLEKYSLIWFCWRTSWKYFLFNKYSEGRILCSSCAISNHNSTSCQNITCSSKNDRSILICSVTAHGHRKT